MNPCGVQRIGFSAWPGAPDSLRYDLIYETRDVSGSLALHFGLSAAPHAQKPAAAKPAAKASQVYLTPTCGCCSKWVDHMKAAGFDMERSVMPQEELDKVAPRQKVPANLRSCHTAVVGKYVIEGHVPADVVQKLLKEGAGDRRPLGAEHAGGIPRHGEPECQALSDRGIQG